MKSKNSFKSLSKLSVGNKEYSYYSLPEAEKNGLEGISRLPKSLKVLLENLLRYEDDVSVGKNQILAMKDWLNTKTSNTEIAYRPARVLLQDFTGIPAVADLAAMRELVKKKNKDPNITTLERELSELLGSSVEIKHNNKGKGKLTISFKNLDALQGVLDKIKS